MIAENIWKMNREPKYMRNDERYDETKEFIGIEYEYLCYNIMFNKGVEDDCINKRVVKIMTSAVGYYVQPSNHDNNKR